MEHWAKMGHVKLFIIHWLKTSTCNLNISLRILKNSDKLNQMHENFDIKNKNPSNVLVKIL